MSEIDSSSPTPNSPKSKSFYRKFRLQNNETEKGNQKLNTDNPRDDAWIHILLLGLFFPLLVMMSRYMEMTQLILISTYILLLDVYFYFLFHTLTKKGHTEHHRVLVSIEDILRSKLDTNDKIYIIQEEI